MLTAFSQREVIEQARDAGALAYLVKPFQKTDLVPAIELAIARYAETRALMAEVGELTERLEMRKLIDRAKGRLIDAYGMKEADAFSFIQKSAMAARTSMRAVAESVLKGDTVPTP
jgi:response regulator NasT